MEKIIINSLRSCNDQVDEKPNSFEMFGYDFMIDEKFNVWILEINKSPTLEASTVHFLYEGSNCKNGFQSLRRYD